MAEWFKALVLKTKVLKGTVGSNPTPTATMESLLGDSFVLLTSSSLIASFCVALIWIYSNHMRRDLINYLKERTEYIYGLWREQANLIHDWQKYITRYQFEGMRWLIALAVATLGIANFSETPNLEVLQIVGLIILVLFVIIAIFFDRWRSRRLYNSQQGDSEFTRGKLEPLMSRVSKWQEAEMTGTLSISPIDMRSSINNELQVWSRGRDKFSFEKWQNKIEDILENVLYLMFAIGLVFYFMGPVLKFMENNRFDNVKVIIVEESAV